MNDWMTPKDWVVVWLFFVLSGFSVFAVGYALVALAAALAQNPVDKFQCIAGGFVALWTTFKFIDWVRDEWKQ